MNLSILAKPRFRAIQKVRKQMFTLRRGDGLRMKLQSVDGQLLMAHAHDLAVAAGGFGEAFGRFVDDEGVVAGDFYGAF